jgi:DNA-binding response OmpR family regulator
VLKALQSDPATARYPVVFLTAHREFTERVRAFRFGVVDYLTKPFTRDVLLRKVEKILETLERRAGSVSREGAAAAGLLEEVQQDARTGVLTVTGEKGESRVVVRAGEVVEQTEPGGGPAARAEFQELDPTHEQIVPPEPTGLPVGRSGLPNLGDIPELWRQVLVVEDNPFFRRFLKELLAQQGFLVYEAGNGEEGLAMALERRPWLILSDVKMPGMDGFELCARVRGHSLIRQTPFLFLSGWDDYKERYHGLELGADDYLSKDTSVRELLLRIQVILRRYADIGTRGRKGMEGRLQMIGPPGVLQMCHLARLSGVLSVEDGPRRAAIRFSEGEIVGADSATATGIKAVHEFLAWERGGFEFVPGEPQGQPLGDSFDQLVLEGCRLLDEKRRAVS